MHDLGLRFSSYNRKKSLMGFDTQLNQRNFQFKNTFDIAVQEDIIAQRIKLHVPKTYVHKDNKLGAK
jgi:hypothetical protein